jgi:F420-0:gamma-glutamyl ligase-like protein
MNEGNIMTNDVMCHINSLIQMIAVAFAVEAPLVFSQNKIYGSVIKAPGVMAWIKQNDKTNKILSFIVTCIPIFFNRISVGTIVITYLKRM